MTQDENNDEKYDNFLSFALLSAFYLPIRIYKANQILFYELNTPFVELQIQFFKNNIGKFLSERYNSSSENDLYRESSQDPENYKFFSNRIEISNGYKFVELGVKKNRVKYKKNDDEKDDDEDKNSYDINYLVIKSHNNMFFPKQIFFFIKKKDYNFKNPYFNTLVLKNIDYSKCKISDFILTIFLKLKYLKNPFIIKECTFESEKIKSIFDNVFDIILQIKHLFKDENVIFNIFGNIELIYSLANTSKNFSTLFYINKNLKCVSLNVPNNDLQKFANCFKDNNPLNKTFSVLNSIQNFIEKNTMINLENLSLIKLQSDLFLFKFEGVFVFFHDKIKETFFYNYKKMNVNLLKIKIIWNIIDQIIFNIL